MDSLRWDTYVRGNTPNMDSHAKMRMVHSRAGITPPSIFGSMMNLSWYGSNGQTPVPWIDRWKWVPKELKMNGYHTVFITQNPMMDLYKDVFNRFFDEYIILKGCAYHAEDMVNKVIDTYNNLDKPLYMFLLFMETHQPFPYKHGLGNDYINAKIKPITRQVKAVEALDKEFGKMIHAIRGTDTDVLVFSDHGELDLALEGHQGHGPALFHDKLFEIPLGRATI